MKILCVCRGGNVRSVTLAYLFKYKYGIDAMAIGWERNSEETKNMMFEWVDVIITVRQAFVEKIPQKYHYKTKVYEIGHDVWGMSLNPELIAICDRLISDDADLMKRINLERLGRKVLWTQDFMG